MNKKTKQVELSDLIDDLTFIPRAIAQEMIDEQVRQGNKANIKVFQESRCATLDSGGFDWESSKKGGAYWAKVLLS